MLMHFHFGLGVKPQEVITGNEAEDTDEEDADEEDADDADSIRDRLTLEEHFNSSDESLLSQFGQMYDTELEVDYKN
ncbi:uncharacterized protein F5147DRAFT_781268 [Suillus discolor]|uniref:Uncharacterized protein n=1 Tax=Suillus discolor TaxID=1912936 RepID=A0A9P7JLK4_9AGAM|nr:uncharacterized protein F5147DRAFT_781268 [Suillus discolor]KAG2087623.1 hypothetical protein F5147DRAFT_781268 [Suillus discolor]